jgi:glycerol-3-phosphate dehydrogenase (NAD(P)+)
MNIAFIGLGVFGKAIASLVEYNGLEYDYAEVAEDRLLSQPADLVFLTVPTKFLRQALEANKQYISDETVIVNCTKGIEEGSHQMAHQIVRSVSRFPYYYSLIGPSFAEGITDRHPTAVSLGYKKSEHVEAIQGILETPYFKVRPSKGYRALELASCLKNVYAIACGYAQGLGYGPNTRAQMITMGLEEFRSLARAMKFADYDVMAPGVVGDMMLTCTSEQSRNFQYGMSLASTTERGEPTVTVEGYYTSRSINALAKLHDAKLPLAALTADIISGEINGNESFLKALAAL